MTRLLFLMLCWPLLLGSASRSFDDANDNIDMGNVLNVTTGNWSLAAWVKLTEDASTDFVIGKVNDINANTAGYMLGSFSSDSQMARCGDGAASCGGAAADIGDFDGVWVYHLATWDATGEVLENYSNCSTLGESLSGTAVGSLSNAVDFQIGEVAGGGTDANGLIAYGSRRATIPTAMERCEQMWHVESVVLFGANGLWPLWGASTEQDLSGNGVTGTVNGASTSTDGPPTMVGGYLPL